MIQLHRLLISLLVLLVCLPAPIRADTPPPPPASPLAEVLFCTATAAGVKKELERQLMSGASCLNGKVRGPVEANICNQAQVYQRPDATGSNIVLQPTPIYQCTRCSRSPDERRCGIRVSTILTIDFELQAEYLVATAAVRGTMRLSTRSAFQDPKITIANLENISGSGNEGPFNVISAVVSPSYRYTGATVVTFDAGAEARAWSARFRANYSSECEVETWNDTYLGIIGLNRSCGLGFSEPAPITVIEGAPVREVPPVPPVDGGPPVEVQPPRRDGGS